MKRERRRHDIGFIAIAVLKLIKGVLLLATGIGALSLLHGNLLALVTDGADAVQVSTQNQLLQKLLQRLGVLDPKQILFISVITFAYSALLLTEGIGLLLEKVWAEYLTAVITASFIPFEMCELIKRFTAVRITLLVVNVLVVIYLSWRLRQRKHRA
jgi:uncharacterized membrane protein (DUF2068 family)